MWPMFATGLTLMEIISADIKTRIIVARDSFGTVTFTRADWDKEFCWNWWGDAGAGRGVVVSDRQGKPVLMRLALRQEMKHNVVSPRPKRANHMNSDVYRIIAARKDGTTRVRLTDSRYCKATQDSARNELRRAKGAITAVIVETPENSIAYDQVTPGSRLLWKFVFTPEGTTTMLTHENGQWV